MDEITGCYPALVTPMDKGNPLDFPINYGAMEKLIDYVVDGGVDGVVVAGCTGHAASMTWDEQLKLIEYVIDYCKSKTKVISGDGSNSTREAIKSIKATEELGVYAHLQISPYQNKPTQEGLFQHYSKIAGAIDGKIILYNVPGRTGRNIEAETTIRLAEECSNIVAVKEASGKIDQIQKILDSKSITVLSGDDPLTLEMIRRGGKGSISVAANVDPARTSRMVKLALDGKIEEAEKINGELKELYRVLFVETNPSPAHYALRKLGIPVGVPRLPMIDVSEKTAKDFDKVLEDLGLKE